MPRPRFTQKARPDQHGRPIPQHLKRNAQELDLIQHPCVVSPVDVAQLSEITSVARFEAEFGKLLRSTPEYHGLGYRALNAALVHLWHAVPASTKCHTAQHIQSYKKSA